eukprot:5884829-Karenia_brevis.AAC.1
MTKSVLPAEKILDEQVFTKGELPNILQCSQDELEANTKGKATKISSGEVKALLEKSIDATKSVLDRSEKE